MDATRPVNIKVTAIEAKILPNFRGEPIRAIADETLKKISGTMIVKIKLRKISPNGFKYLADSPK